MSDDKFQMGEIYFIGGYHDSARTFPCVIKPVVFLDAQRRAKAGENLTYSFEELESWLERDGQGSPNKRRMETIEGPPEMTLAMSLDELIDDLLKLRVRLRERKP
ncbi:hypothetical protein [Usitatibacter palustris]|uniref:Uncharacterized protein n=1 Tax=Usitatibacter palustris TaxID=2732487 RepID=A0A6M4H327_9PROT|nr:hypothetical protein [Usitatibacter palustris]QJR13840.1 hypothetical protein DSM104440_00630 [Usitatibacter palustris]